jgi:hypothetical protein
MKIIFRFLIVFLIFPLLLPVLAEAQTIPTGIPVLSDAYRRAQLLGKINPNVSFTSFPLFPKAAFSVQNSFYPDSSLEKSLMKFNGIIRFGKGKGIVQLLPVSWQQQVNSLHPQGLNDGAMIPSRGYETLFSAGIYAKYGPLSIQLWPEVVYAQNKPYDGFPVDYPDIRWAQYYWTLNLIDMPERFGNGSYQKITWGQSSIRLTFGAVSLGLSNENLWWGPGARNALIMTNNAAGFKHLTFNTARPVKTFLGSFEWQLIAGRLEPSGFDPPGADRTFRGKLLYTPKPDDWRYLSGLLVTYHPKWVPGLFLGFARTVQQYHKDMIGNLKDYFPVFMPLGLEKAGGDGELANKRSQLWSVFARWLWVKGHGEVYFEYGRSDYFWNGRDFKVEPAHSGAFVLGFKKLIPLNRHQNENMEVLMEFTQLSMNSTTINRNGLSWYLNHAVQAGYTHEGQYLGAGIGPGGNMQTLEVNWVKSLKTIGLRIERYVHNNDFFYLYIKDVRRNWVDISASLLGTWPYKNILFNAQLEWTKSLNYEWQFTPPPAPVHWAPGLDVTNFHFKMGITYRF